MVAHLPGDGGPRFLLQLTEILDDYFRESFASSSVGPQMRVDRNPCAIIALGGYGRKEQYLQSDVDLLLLFKERIPEEAKGLVQEILYPLWDIRLQVSYALRSLKECCSLAGRDFEVLTSLIDARFVCGISALYSQLMEQLDGRVLRRQGAAYVAWLSKGIRDRHKRFGDSTYLLEPNLKEGLGGLRDYHTMLWTARAICNLTEPRDLEYLGYLSHEEFHSLTQALAFVTRVRNRLHHLAGRKCDQLHFEYQVKLADALGFREENGQQAVEAFLGALHGQMECVKRQHLMFLGKTVGAKKTRGRQKKERRTLVEGIEVVRDTVCFASSEAILEKPHVLIRIFEYSALLGLPLSVEAERLVKEFLYLIDDAFRRSPRVVTSFQRILSAPPRPHNVLNEMLNTGILLALIPEMKGIVNRIQYDEYHVYPVDKHLLRTVQTLKELRDVGPGMQDAFYRELFKEIQNPDLLLWAGLLHDVGKAVDEQGHPTHGEHIVRQVFSRMGFSDQDVESISFLVREHLFLMHTATRRDIDDEKIVIQCARSFGNVEQLKMLYLLTVADSKATGPKAWGEWNATLLKQLFLKLLHILEKGELATPAVTDALDRKKHQVLHGAGSLPSALNGLFDQMSPRYLLYTPADDIIRHIALYQMLGDEPFLLEVQGNLQSSYRAVTVCARDFPGLFSKIAGVFTLNNVDILSAQIYTWGNDIALDVFKVEPPLDRLREEEVWARVKSDLRAVLEGKLALEPALGQKVQAYRSHQRGLTRMPDKIVADNETSDFFTIIEVYTHDFPGLLYELTDTLFRCKLNIWVAKIATKVDQVVDVFYVRDLEGQKVDNPRHVAAVKTAIRETLEGGPRGMYEKARISSPGAQA